MAKFEVGKSYTHTVLVRDGNGNKSTRTEIYTITKRTPCYVTFYHIAWSGSKMPHGRCKILTAEPFGEYIHLGVLSGYLYAENIVNDDSQPEAAELPATAEITQATDNDNATASQPASVASSQSETNDDAKSLLDADYFKGKSIDEIKRAFSHASLKQLKGFALCYTIPYFNRMNKKQLIDAIASKISLILEERKGYMTAENVTGDNGYAQQDDIIIPATKPRTIPEPVRVKFIPGTVYAGNDSGNHFPVKITARNADSVTTDFIGAYIKYAKIQTIAGVEHAVFPMQYRNIEIWADKPELPEPVQSKTSAQLEITQPDNLYDDGSFSDAPGDNSECARNQDFPVDIPERREPDSIPADNPGFTVIPHDRMHITRPDYTVYPDAIHDDIPCVNVPACETLTLASAAVVPYADAATIRKIFRIIAIYLRFWFESHLHQHHEPIPSHVFAPWFIELADYAPGNPNDISTLQYKWQRKKFSEKLNLCRSQIASCKTREEIIACLQNVSSESIRLLCVADRVLGKFARISANSECERKLAYAQIYADKIIQRREKAMTISAETRDITAVKKKKKYTVNPSPRIEVRPEKAPDIEHKLIDTTNLHFQERRKALDHNAAVISSCMFHEAIVSMLLKISPAAICQLGFHMGLFIAKPKGKKIVIAEAFAKRLIEHRELHAKNAASVHTSNTHQTSKNTAGVPDNVKFFETKHGQFAFMFTDELVFTD